MESTWTEKTAWLTRRRVLVCSTAGLVSLAGCLSPGNNDDPATEPTGSLHVIASSTVDQPVRLDVALVDPGAGFEESIISTSHLRVGTTVEETVDEIHGGPFHVVVQASGENEGDSWEDFEKEWRLENCLEVTLQATVADRDLAVTWGCTYPPEDA